MIHVSVLFSIIVTRLHSAPVITVVASMYVRILVVAFYPLFIVSP